MMGMFAELLRGMTEIGADIVADLQTGDFAEDTETSISGQSNEGQEVATLSSSASHSSASGSGSGPHRYHPPNSSNNGSFRVSDLGASFRPMVTGQFGSSGGGVV